MEIYCTADEWHRVGPAIVRLGVDRLVLTDIGRANNPVPAYVLPFLDRKAAPDAERVDAAHLAWAQAVAEATEAEDGETVTAFELSNALNLVPDNTPVRVALVKGQGARIIADVRNIFRSSEYLLLGTRPNHQV